VIQISPPLVATQAEFDEMTGILVTCSPRLGSSCIDRRSCGTVFGRCGDRLRHPLIGLTKRFDDVVAVDDISLDIERGHFFALLGPSGCGKTTTLRMIGGFEEPTQGRIELGGRRRGRRAALQARREHGLPVVCALPAPLDLRERGLRAAPRGVKKASCARGSTKRSSRRSRGARAPQATAALGRTAAAVALARALVNRPRVLLLDEPLGALDLKLRKEMQLELKRIQNEVGITFVHVTHDQEEAMTMADRIVIMNSGQIEQLGTPTELYESPRTAFVAGFLGVSNLLEGEVVGEGTVKLTDGTIVRVPSEALKRTGFLQIGVRPEKLRIGGGEENSLVGTVTESAYIGVSTQYILDTPAGPMTVYVQNDRPGGQVATGERLTLSWSPESTFVVDAQEGTDHD
jgi:spermidine/putrescine transport system ATP-binding protein